MKGPFHAGELELQRRAGVLDEARDVGRIIRSAIPAGAARFLARQRCAIVASADDGGRVWASVLSGPAGFIRVVDGEMLHLAVQPIAADPLVASLTSRQNAGLLVLDPRTRQRLRFNGQALLTPEGVFLVVKQAFGNCPKYIQRRALERGCEADARPPRVASRLDPSQHERIRCADTFFIASVHPKSGADASHRGGFPGFVRVLGADRLAFDDYPGNGMFNTLGNLLLHPQTGLLFVDFESGDLLQLTGRAEVGADFSVRFDVDAVRDTPAGNSLRWSFVDYSPVNPRLSQPASGGIQSTAGGTRQEESR